MTNHSNSGNGDALTKGSSGKSTHPSRDAMMAGINEPHASLDELRLSMKYLVFDLEATRRENSQLRRQLAELSDPDEGDLDTDSDDN